MAKQEYPNVTEVRLQARDDWEKRQRKRQSRIEKISNSMDFWIVFIVLSFVALSIPHTMKVFDMITPGWGRLAFIGLELGLLYRSFRGKVAKIKSGSLPGSLIFLAWLLFVSLVVANGVGAFIAVSDSQSVIEEMSLSEIFKSWPDLPASAQIALILVPLAALMIPVGTMVGGEGLAALLLESREDGNPIDDLWSEVAQDVEFVALRDAALNMKRTPKQANRWASEVVGLDIGGQAERRPQSSGSGQSPDTSGHAGGQGYKKNMDAKSAVFRYLAEHGDDDLSVRVLASEVSREIAPVGRSTAHDARREWRAARNGHDNVGEE